MQATNFFGFRPNGFMKLPGGLFGLMDADGNSWHFTDGIFAWYRRSQFLLADGRCTGASRVFGRSQQSCYREAVCITVDDTQSKLRLGHQHYSVEVLNVVATRFFGHFVFFVNL